MIYLNFVHNKLVAHNKKNHNSTDLGLYLHEITTAYFPTN